MCPPTKFMWLAQLQDMPASSPHWVKRVSPPPGIPGEAWQDLYPEARDEKQLSGSELPGHWNGTSDMMSKICDGTEPLGWATWQDILVHSKYFQDDDFPTILSFWQYIHLIKNLFLKTQITWHTLATTIASRVTALHFCHDCKKWPQVNSCLGYFQVHLDKVMSWIFPSPHYTLFTQFIAHLCWDHQMFQCSTNNCFSQQQWAVQCQCYIY